jgi:carotenoid 1,2-hydratase
VHRGISVSKLPDAAEFGSDALGPRFDAAVPEGGYAWWYLDGISEDGQEAVTVIVFVGSVFSPYYYRARARARAAAGKSVADPRRHCGFNVALYRREAKNWVFTESRGESVRADARSFELGGNRIAWEGGTLVVRVDDRTAPWRRPIRGELRLVPTAPPADNAWGAIELDANREHRWLPVAPTALIEASFEQPEWSFRGSGYHDSNWGDSALEDAFSSWNWCRSERGDETKVVYDLLPRNAERRRHAWSFTPGGPRRSLEGLGEIDHRLPETQWKVERCTRSDPDTVPELVRTLEDAPFYSRSLLSTTLEGGAGLTMHESLDLDRFRRRTTQFMLPFRMRRRA